jgi:sensor histidine kinase YesM
MSVQPINNPSRTLNILNGKKVRQYALIVAFISTGMSILVHFNNVLSLFLIFSKTEHENLAHINATNVFANVITTALITFCIFMLNFYIVKPLDGLKATKPKSIVMSILVTLVSVFILSEFFFKLNHLITQEIKTDQLHLLYFFKDIFIAIIVLISVYVIKGFNEKQAILLENEKLNTENLQSQYQSLKNQVSPHFLFNSLTALKELIDEDPGNARKYVSHLSQVLRYTLQSNQNQSVCLSDELDSVKSYLFLIKMRFGENLKINFNVDEKYRNYLLPPLVIQTLIENAVKHNEVSKREPLIINLSTTDDMSLVVSNSLRERITREPATGIGLANLSKQYQLLCGEEITISKTVNEFRVEVPLLKP